MLISRWRTSFRKSLHTNNDIIETLKAVACCHFFSTGRAETVGEARNNQRSRCVGKQNR